MLAREAPFPVDHHIRASSVPLPLAETFFMLINLCRPQFARPMLAAAVLALFTWMQLNAARAEKALSLKDSVPIITTNGERYLTIEAELGSPRAEDKLCFTRPHGPSLIWRLLKDSDTPC